MRGASAPLALKAEDFVGLHGQAHQIRWGDVLHVLREHLLQDPTGLGAGLSNVDAKLLLECLVYELA